jgi:2-oxoglutarate ferredoxin oxidoreductase subunit gamma
VKYTEIRIAGYGGQGVILAAQIIGKAAAIYGGAYATMTQNYGPEARGGAASSQLILSPDPILYPYPTKPDILVVMSPEAFTRFVPEMNPHGLLVVETDLVKMSEVPPAVRVAGIQATRVAEELGKKMVLNVVMVGFFAAQSNLLPKEAYIQAVKESVPAQLRDLNVQAFERGYQFAGTLEPSLEADPAELEVLG